jgi:hypothetical protein
MRKFKFEALLYRTWTKIKRDVKFGLYQVDSFTGFFNASRYDEYLTLQVFRCHGIIPYSSASAKVQSCLHRLKHG